MYKKRWIGIFFIVLFLIVIISLIIIQNNKEVKNESNKKTSLATSDVKKEKETKPNYIELIVSYEQEAFHKESIYPYNDIYQEYMRYANSIGYEQREEILNDFYEVAKKARTMNDQMRDEFIEEKNIPEGTPKDLKEDFLKINKTFYEAYDIGASGYDEAMKFKDTRSIYTLEQANKTIYSSTDKKREAVKLLQEMKTKYNVPIQ
jgi:hypothetical protein